MPDTIPPPPDAPDARISDEPAHPADERAAVGARTPAGGAAGPGAATPVSGRPKTPELSAVTDEAGARGAARQESINAANALPSPPGAPGENPDVGHEERDARVRPIAIFGLSLLALVLLSLGLVWGLARLYNVTNPSPTLLPTPVTPASRLPPDPRLQEDPTRDLIEYTTENEQDLKSYGWIDQQRGIAKMPIERAITLTLERGLPARETGAQPQEQGNGP